MQKNYSGRELHMEEVELLEYTDENWDAVCLIHDRARPIELAGSCDERAFIPLSEDKSDHNNFHNSIKYVAYLENNIVGFVGTRKSEITWLYVEPQLFGRGIGRALLNKAMMDISDRAYLSILDGNIAAKQLYISEGFTVIESVQSKENGYDCTVLKLLQ